MSEQDNESPMENLLDLGDEQALQVLKLLRKNPSLRRLIDKEVMGSNLPAKGRPFGPYYKRVYAIQVKEVIDAMMIDRQPRIFRYSNFPNARPRSLYLRISQAFNYLIREMDEDLKYAMFRKEVEICSEKEGVTIRFASTLTDKNELLEKAELITTKEETHKWKDKVNDFLETSQYGEKLELDNLNLSDEAVENLRISLEPLTDIMSFIDNSGIKLFKVNPDLLT